MPVLAVLAVEVTADSSQRVRECAGQVMEERFFLDGIDRLTAGPPICHRVERAILVVPHPADTVPALIDSASVVAERALHRIVYGFCILERFMHGHHRQASGRDAATRDAAGLLLFEVSILIFISFEHKRSPVFAALAQVDLSHVASGNREYVTALADRAVNHVQQLYMSIRHKN
jgi:hypothetical protein